MTPVSVAFKKKREYFPSVISVSDRFFMVLVVYKGSHISVSDRFLFKKRFYFDICIGFIPVFFPMGIIYLWYGIDISLVWELYIDRFFMVLVVYKGS